MPNMHMNLHADMSLDEMRQALHAFAASTDKSNAEHKLAMDAQFAGLAQQASDIFTAATKTNESQHNYIVQREVEHKQAIDEHQRRYKRLEEDLASEKIRSDRRYSEFSQTPATASMDAGIDIFEDNSLSMNSIEAFMEEEHIDTAELPMFNVAQTGSNTN
jgi:hypothetical protein